MFKTSGNILPYKNCSLLSLYFLSEPKSSFNKSPKTTKDVVVTTPAKKVTGIIPVNAPTKFNGSATALKFTASFHQILRLLFCFS